MADFFNWLVGGSFSSLAFLVIIGTITFVMLLIYIIAFIQGREVTIGSLNIGKRPDLKPQNIDKIIAENNEIFKFPMIIRDQVDLVIGTVQQRLKNAKNEIRISGNDNKFIAESASIWVKEALSRGVTVKILCIDPESAVPTMLAKIDPRFPTAESFKDSMESVEKELLRIRKEFPHNFEFRYLPILPAIGFFITDPSSYSGMTKIEIYISKPYKYIDSRPHIIIPHDLNEWRDYFNSQWDNYWNISRELK